MWWTAKGKENEVEAFNYLNVVNWILSFSLFRNQCFALLSQVRAHALTHCLQTIWHTAEQLVHASKVCKQEWEIMQDICVCYTSVTQSAQSWSWQLKFSHLRHKASCKSSGTRFFWSLSFSPDKMLTAEASKWKAKTLFSYFSLSGAGSLPLLPPGQQKMGIVNLWDLQQDYAFQGI